MNYIVYIFGLLVAFGMSMYLVLGTARSVSEGETGVGGGPPDEFIDTQQLTIENDAFTEFDILPKRYTCDAEGISPSLNIRGVPASTQSLALVFESISPRAGSSILWSAWSIPADTTFIAEGALPEGSIEGTNDQGVIGYSPPCFDGDLSTYILTIYALEMTPELPEGSRHEALVEPLNSYAIEKSSVTGRY